MDALTREEYPAMLEQLQPSVAVAKLNERVKKIGKINLGIADWLQDRRKVEEVYAASLRKLAKRALPDVGDQMGVFGSPWRQIQTAVDEIASSHSLFSQYMERDVELSLRNFEATNSEMASVITMQKNIQSLAREFQDARDRNERLIRKGSRVSTARLNAASTRLQSASQQWDVQAAFVFESLQALDERRIHHLRDKLTQYQTYEADRIERNREIIERTLKSILDINSEVEINNWSRINKAEKTSVKQNAIPSTENSSELLPTASSTHGDSLSERSQQSKAESGERKTLQRMGTLLTRRRQSVHTVFRSDSPASKNGLQSFGRGLSSLTTRARSPPRVGSSNVMESENRLSSLPESSPTLSPVKDGDDNVPDATLTINLPTRKSSLPSPDIKSFGEALNAVTPEAKSVPPPISSKEEPLVDDEGFSVPLAMNDPISQVEQEIAQADQPQFKLNIRIDPIPEQESDAKAALSSVTNALRTSQISLPTRKSGTFRGRRDAQNTMALQSGDRLTLTPEHALQSPPIPISPMIKPGKAVSISRISSSEQAALSGSDNASIRSGQSWTMPTHARHIEAPSPGLNCSIFETMSALFEDETPVSININGEIAFNYNSDGSTESCSPPGFKTIKILNVSSIEMLAPRKSFIQPISIENKDQFSINLSSILSRFLVGFTYRVRNSDPTQTIVPILIKAAWKRQATKLGLVLEISLNPAFSQTPVTFNNLILIANYSGKAASSCQTKPSGTHIRDKLLVYWRLGDVTLDGTWLKAIARFSGTEDNIPEPGSVEIKWELNGNEKLLNSIPTSGGIRVLELADERTGVSIKDTREDTNPFIDEPPVAEAVTALDSSLSVSKIIEGEEPEGNCNIRWSECAMVKKLVSGKYYSK